MGRGSGQQVLAHAWCWVAVAYSGKGPQGPREKVGERKLLAGKISTLSPKLDSLEF